MSITRSNVDTTSARTQSHHIRRCDGLGRLQVFNTARTTHPVVKFDSILDSPGLGYGTSNACFSPIDTADEKPGQWVGQCHRQGRYRSDILRNILSTDNNFGSHTSCLLNLVSYRYPVSISSVVYSCRCIGSSCHFTTEMAYHSTRVSDRAFRGASASIFELCAVM